LAFSFISITDKAEISSQCNAISWRTKNNRSQWTWQNPLPQSNSLSSVYFTDANTGYNAGESGNILKTTNGGDPLVYIEEPTALHTTFTIYPNPANNKIAITGSRKLFEEPIITVLSITGQQGMQDNFQNQP
jgi:photosystem II stability/assembly factor-like uncharacterized protein